MARTAHSSPHPPLGGGWSPPTHAPFVLTPVGVWWDAVRVPYDVGVDVVRRLGNAGGSVIGDPYGAWLYWLVPTGTGAVWGGLPAEAGAVHVSVACWLPVPARDRTGPPGPYWAVPFARDRVLTDPDRLRGALAERAEAR
ncbi:hypothetical protein FM076_17265 [Streptomyces albus subsp. chlorinus]|uniref:hypothetical protein n=1 Tax=Streptomyces albus TaxID=1888 RepID=UPI00156F188E|nr:hypothetical protein [Streptomyces albus]NSC22823.1 hypothetical protein [Streptomyces albus subsp. chlorinus]